MFVESFDALVFSFLLFFPITVRNVRNKDSPEIEVDALKPHPGTEQSSSEVGFRASLNDIPCISILPI
ncbi:hypothetical protein PanWU01x14_247160 [Parasponia andersonii]|uniref:Transmembrane protein n=1 Tax=Parasponia andersonii TaxID=3476 RepID=A0A2P5BE80_PARAD|nr:hypothetical protein PanWU01x14_247160 [Parasponia andersonii]